MPSPYPSLEGGGTGNAGVPALRLSLLGFPSPYPSLGGIGSQSASRRPVVGQGRVKTAVIRYDGGVGRWFHRPPIGGLSCNGTDAPGVVILDALTWGRAMPAHAGPEQRREWVLAALERYEAPLVRFARRLLGDEEAARDAVQHAFLRLCDQPLDEVEGHVAQWLFTVCRNKAVDYLRSRQRAGSSGDLELPHCSSKEPDPAEVAEQHDLHERLRRLVDELPRGQREAITLWAEGFTYREIAEMLRTTEGNVRVLMHRAIKRVRQHPLARHLGAGPDPAEAHCDPAREVRT